MKLGIAIKLIIFGFLCGVSFTATFAKAEQCANPVTGDLSAVTSEIKQLIHTVSQQFCLQQDAKSLSWKTVKITSVQRTVEAQAGYILNCLKSGCGVYENQAAIAEYQALAIRNKQTIADKIHDQITRNCYISKHLSNRAVDIGTAGHSPAEVERLKNLIRANSYIVDNVSYVVWIEDRSHGTGPHLHLNFEPYGFIADQCPK